MKASGLFVGFVLGLNRFFLSAGVVGFVEVVGFGTNGVLVVINTSPLLLTK